MQKVPEDKLLTVRQVSELIGFSISTVYSGECGTNELVRIKFRQAGKARPAIRFSYLNVQGWIAKHKTEAEAQQRQAAAKQQSTLTRADVQAAVEPFQLRLVKNNG